VVNAFFGPGGPACQVCAEIGVAGSCDIPTGEDIDVQPLSDSQWRVIDRRVPVNDACSLLGFIEVKGE
jgi:hypothetical protein